MRPRQVDARPLDPPRARVRPHRRRGQPDARAEPPHRAGAGERPPQDGGRCAKTSGADIRAKATATAANARRCPVSAQRGIPGAPRSAHCRVPAHPPRPKAPDPVGPDVPGAFEASRGGYGARRPKVALERAGTTASRRRICRIMREDGLSSACSGRAPKGGDRPGAAAFGGERPGEVLRRPRAAHPRRGRPRLRARRRLVALRAPARRPLQPRDSRLLARAARGRAAGQGRLLERAVPAHRHRGLPRRQ